MKLQYHVKQSFDLLKDIDNNKCICTYLHKMHNFFFYDTEISGYLCKGEMD